MSCLVSALLFFFFLRFFFLPFPVFLFMGVPLVLPALGVLEPAPALLNVRAFHPFVEIMANAGLLHTLSHLLIQSLAMRCGYPASSIRERIYADTKAGRFGILLLW